MIDLTKYLSLSHMMVLATIDKEQKPYTANVYFGYHPESYECYFISRPTREHSQHIERNNTIAWSIIDTQKYNPTDTDKKGLQFQGKCYKVEGEEGQRIFEMYYQSRIAFPTFPEGHEVYKCIPSKVKIWDETLYGGEGKVIEL